MKTWNKNDWQGKRKSQIGYSELMTIIAMSLFLLTVVAIVLTKE